MAQLAQGMIGTGCSKCISLPLTLLPGPFWELAVLDALGF